MQIPIIHEDRDFLVLEKPAGIAVQRGAGVRGETIVDWLTARYPEIKKVGDNQKERPGIVHRLDKDTSGVMLIARNQETFDALKHLFKKRFIEKTYLALAWGEFKEPRGIIETPIGRSLTNRTKRTSLLRLAAHPQPAKTFYRVLERFNGFTLLEVTPQSGRMHQIRVHLNSIGHPVAGDALYGGKRAALAGLRRQFLHASALQFSFPEGRRWHFETALPEDLSKILRALRNLRKSKKHATRIS